MHANLHELNKHFGVEDVLAFSAGQGGLWRASITTDKCVAELYRHGAHLTRWRPTGQDEVLWVSALARYEYGVPIRGGVPICFPWFAGNRPANEPDGPSHGYARTTTWEFIDACVEDGAVSLTMRAIIEPFTLRYVVTFSDTLTMHLEVANAGEVPASFESALHTYFSIGQIGQVSVHGLEGADYLDTVGGQDVQKQQDDEPLMFDAETDRTYASSAGVRIDDPAMSRSITINKQGSGSTVVWNPWFDKAKSMGDMDNDEWPGMLCVESGNIAPNAVTLEPGKTHRMHVVISVQPVP